MVETDRFELPEARLRLAEPSHLNRRAPSAQVVVLRGSAVANLVLSRSCCIMVPFSIQTDINASYPSNCP